MPHYPAIEIVYQTVPERLNEDAYLIQTAAPLSEQIIFAAIDGATTRLTPPPLQTYLDTLPQTLTPAGFAARFVRDALAQHITAGEVTDLRALMLAANADLGAAVRDILGDLTLDAMQFPPELYDTLKHDPRLVRLGLPVCVMTLAAYDPADHTLHYAHAGDTALLVVYEDGRAEIPTARQREFDSPLLATMGQLRAQNPGLSTRDITQNPDLRHLNLHNGLNHNYVDEHGLPQPNRGTGVLNGQPELRYFVRTGELSLDGVALVCVMTDGLEWPTSAEEAFAGDATTAANLRDQRIIYMAEQITARGLRGYLDHLRATETADADHDQFPRMKTHDDAAGVLLRFG
ncbi:MAG: hypothetical protein JXA10_03520 [Anaerolineae bacterium]|nr:hypothetical protein [Anaerolineae bacterium]